MLFRRRKRKPVHISYYFRPMQKKTKALITLIVVLSLFSLSFTIFYARARPILIELAESAVTDVVVFAVNDVIDDTLAEGDLNYEKLVTLEKDESGNITALVTNMAMINSLQTKISNGVTESVKDKVMTTLEIPMGNIIGGPLFSGRGPMIPVRILSITDVRTKFSNSFLSAGINQTRHKIMLEITVDIDMLVPGCTTSTVVTIETAIAETVLVGQVPNIYAG